MQKKFKKIILKNGLTFLFEKRDLPIVSMIIAVKHGGIHEEINEKGISHFIEHMLYKGTVKRDAKKIAEDIEKNGGEMNGFTSETATGYWCKIPSRNAEIALEVLLDMVKNPLFDEKEIEKERKVIFEEIKMHRDNPRLYVVDEIQKCLYSGTLGENLAGNFEILNNLSKEKLLEKFQKMYNPKNMVFCVVGNCNFNKLKNYLENNFKNHGKSAELQNFGLINEKKIEFREGIDQANLCFGVHMPLAKHRDSYVAYLLTTILAGGMSSRLFSEIREKRNLAYAIKGDLNINKDFSYFYIYAGTNKENVKKIKSLILKEFAQVSKNLTEKELNLAKNQLIGNYEISLEDSQQQMINLFSSEINTKAEDFYSFIENVKKVKLKDVKRLAILKDYSFFALLPKK